MVNPGAAGRSEVSVLLADDDPVIRKSYGNQMRAEGWNVTIAADGYEATQALDRQTFDVVLLDARMPYRNGAEVLRVLRAKPEMAEAAVFVLAQPGDAELADRAMREGADGVLDKARVTPRDIVLEIESFFDPGGRALRDDGAPPATEAPSGGPSRGAASMNVPSAVDEIAKRFRRPTQTRTADEPRGAPPSRPATMAGGAGSAKDAAAARAVAARLSQRQQGEPGRAAPPPPRRQTAFLEEALQADPELLPEAPTAPPEFEQEAVPTARSDAPYFSIVLNRFVGESAKLAAALGLPTDYLCPVCGQQLALRLWVDPTTEAGVRGHFYCPRCTAV